MENSFLTKTSLKSGLDLSVESTSHRWFNFGKKMQLYFQFNKIIRIMLQENSCSHNNKKKKRWTISTSIKNKKTIKWVKNVSTSLFSFYISFLNLPTGWVYTNNCTAKSHLFMKIAWKTCATKSRRDICLCIIPNIYKNYFGIKLKNSFRVWVWKSVNKK